jgi:uncharacterized membrane protein (Fun14 family)
MANECSESGGPRSGKPPWQAKTLWVAAGLTLLGLVLWVAVPKSDAPASAGGGQATLAQTSGDAVATGVHSLQGSPALFRFGLSYIAGFFLGYGLRRFLKVTLIVSVLAVGAILLLQQVGWMQLDWGGIQSHLSDSFAWLRGQAEALKVLILGYVPSAAAAGVGLVFGARWR